MFYIGQQVKIKGIDRDLVILDIGMIATSAENNVLRFYVCSMDESFQGICNFEDLEEN